MAVWNILPYPTTKLYGTSLLTVTFPTAEVRRYKSTVSLGFATSSDSTIIHSPLHPPPLNYTSYASNSHRTNPSIGITSTLTLLVALKITILCSSQRNGSSHAPRCTNQARPWSCGSGVQPSGLCVQPSGNPGTDGGKFRSTQVPMLCVATGTDDSSATVCTPQSAMYSVPLLSPPWPSQRASPPGMTTPHVYQHPVPVQTLGLPLFFRGES